jgi:predicted transcriptional regulator
LDLSALRRSEAVSDSSIRVSDALMAELQRAADAEQRSPEEVVEGAVERYLRLKRRERLYAYGECQAERVGVEEEDVLALVKETRRDTSARSR